MAGINLSQFRDLQLVGQGGGADVYRAVRVSTGGEVAIKAFLATLDPATVARRVNREVGALVSLKGHPNIIQIEEVLQVDDAVYVVMEYAPNGSLADRIAAEGSVDPAALMTIGAQIASALSAAHSKSILHRDVKPQNILFGQYGAAKLCDFGIAAITANEQASRTSAISIRYASPEELDGAALTSATDIYSLGATLLHAFVGRPADLNERLGGIDVLVADAPQPLRDVIRRCLELDPAQRPSADEVHRLLDKDAPTGTPLAPPTGQPWSIELNSPLPPDRPPATGARAGVPGSTVGVLFDRTPEPEPEPSAPVRWYRRPLVVVAAIVLVAAIAAGIVIAVTSGGDDEAAPTTTKAPVAVTTTGPAPTTTAAPTTTVAVTTTTAAPTTTAVPTTAAPAPVNAYGDVVGAPVDGTSGKAAAFAVALQQHSSASNAVLNLSPAYYYALSFQLTPRVADVSAQPVATERGYVITTAAGPIEVRDFVLDADGNVVDGTEVGPVTFAFSAGVETTGVCATGRPQPCDFSIGGGLPDTRGSAAQAWVLARVTADPERLITMIFVDTGGPLVVSATGAGEPMGVDPATGIVALSVAPTTAPGTVVPLDVVLTDGTAMSFSVQVA